MKILVTGSSGHLGQALISVLQRSNIECIGIDINPSKFTSIVGSITDKQFVSKVIKDVDVIVHTATLHKPHVATHSIKDFIDTNVNGTLNLLEHARDSDIHGLIFTSTTSTFGDALTPKGNEPAVWVTEETRSIPKNIYGVTKNAAEDLCQLFYRNYKLPCLILKTSRFFMEQDDDRELRGRYDDLNIKANEYLYRRVDVEDVVSAHLLAIDKLREIGFSKYIISASSPFKHTDLNSLSSDAISVVKKIYPDFEATYLEKGWKMFPKIGRVYVNDKARKELGWNPKHDFQHVLSCIRKGSDFRSRLSFHVGVKGYHKEKFSEGPYPI